MVNHGLKGNREIKTWVYNLCTLYFSALSHTVGIIHPEWMKMSSILYMSGSHAEEILVIRLSIMSQLKHKNLTGSALDVTIYQEFVCAHDSHFILNNFHCLK